VKIPPVRPPATDCGRLTGAGGGGGGGGERARDRYTPSNRDGWLSKLPALFTRSLNRDSRRRDGGGGAADTLFVNQPPTATATAAKMGQLIWLPKKEKLPISRSDAEKISSASRSRGGVLVLDEANCLIEPHCLRFERSLWSAPPPPALTA